MIFGITNFKVNNNLGFYSKSNVVNKYPNLTPLKADTISFGAMKKTQFDGIDLLIVNKFKVPIEKFNKNKDLQNWCKEKTDKLRETDLSGRYIETRLQREAQMKEWSDYVFYENDAYTDSMALMIFDGILKNIKSDNDAEIPPLNKGALAKTIDEIEAQAKVNPKAEINFNKTYRLNLQNIALDNLETHLDSNETGWIVIPSEKNDPEHFEENVDRLKTLSHKSWCTASFNAEPYLKQGDFHVYMECGKPKLGVRFRDDEVAEIQGEKNNSKIPIKYLDIAKEHTKDNKLADLTTRQFEQAESAKNKIAHYENKLKRKGVDFKTCSVRQLFDVLGVKYRVDKQDGLLILDKYCQLDRDFTFDDIGIDENKLFKEIKEVSGDFILKDSLLTDLGNLRRIGGKADFTSSSVKDLGQLQRIDGSAKFTSSEVTNLGNLEFIGGSASFKHSKITDLGNLKYIGEDVSFANSKITGLGNLQSIGGDAGFNYSEITDLGNLKNIEGNLYLYNSKMKYKDFKDIDLKCHIRQVENKLKKQGVDFNTCSYRQMLDALDVKYKVDRNGLLTIDEYIRPDKDFSLREIFDDENRFFKEIKEIKGDLNLFHSNATDLGNLQKIGGEADFFKSKLESLGQLKSVGRDMKLGHTKIKSLDNLESVGGDLWLASSNVVDLGNLQKIGGDARFEFSYVKNLGNLQTIGGNAMFSNSSVEGLGDLRKIYGGAWFGQSEIRSLGNLEEIGNIADFENSNVEDLGKLKRIGDSALFNGSKVKSLGDLKHIHGNAQFSYSEVEDLGALRKIHGRLFIDNSKLKKDDFKNIQVDDYYVLPWD